jgi:hypothetical protein
VVEEEEEEEEEDLGPPLWLKEVDDGEEDEEEEDDVGNVSFPLPPVMLMGLWLLMGGISPFPPAVGSALTLVERNVRSWFLSFLTLFRLKDMDLYFRVKSSALSFLCIYVYIYLTVSHGEFYFYIL